MNSAKRCESEKTSDTPLEKLWDEHDLHRITGRAVGSLRRDRLLGKGFPFVKLGHLVRYCPQDVRDHIRRNLHGVNREAK